MIEKVVNGVIFGAPDIQNQLADLRRGRRDALNQPEARKAGGLALFQVLVGGSYGFGLYQPSWYGPLRHRSGG